MNKTIAVFGATSAIAKAYCRLQANSSNHLILVARNDKLLDETKNDLVARGAGNVTTHLFDFSHINELDALTDQVFRNSIDIVLIAYGTLPDHEKCKADLGYALEQHTVNSTSTVLLMGSIARKMKLQQKGTIAAITSVAGDRGKKSNYYYGAAKASVSVFLQGLRQELSKTGIHVVNIKPGFVDTPMTENFKKGFLWAKPEQIAKGIHCAIEKRKNTVYLPFFWRWIMCIIRSIPESIFKKLEM